MTRRTNSGRSTLLAGIACAALTTTALPASQAATGTSVTDPADTTAGSTAAATTTYNRAPINEISGPATDLAGGTRDVAVDADGNVYVASASGGVRVFGPEASGNDAPIRTLAGPATQMTSTVGLDVDDEGWLYVTNPANNRILVFAPGASGNVAPTRVIAGANTGLSSPFGLELTSDGSIAVVNAGAPVSITVHRATAAGNVGPDRTISGPATALAAPFSVDVGPDDSFAVGDLSAKVMTYAPAANGNQAPSLTILGSNADFGQAAGVAFDSDSNLYVSSFNAPHNAVLAFRPGENEAAVRLQGPATRLTNPTGVHVYDKHRLLVADANPGALLTFKALLKKQTKPGKVRALKVKGKAGAKNRKVTWKKPKADGNAEITGYRVVVKKGNKTLLKKTVTKRTITLKRGQLRNGQNKVTIRAVNAKGLGKGVTKKFTVKK